MDALSKNDNCILRLVKILLGLCLAVPLLMSSSFIFPYTVPKAFIFRILIEIAAVLYFYLALKYPKIFCHSGPRIKYGASFEPGSRFRDSGSPAYRTGRRIKCGMTIGATVFIFLLINFLSALFGTDFYTSWWGNLERMLGIWGLLHFAAFFIMLATIFKTQKDWRILMKVSVAVSIVVAALALIQRLGGWGNLLPPIDRIYGTIGNAGFFAGYLLVNIFLAGYLAISSIGKKRWFFLFNSLFLVISLFLSGTRGAYLGLLVGVMAGLSLIFIFYENHKIKKYILTCFLVIVIAAGSLFLFRNTSFVKNNFILSRAASIFSSGTTIQSRLILWQDAWRAWQARPILGWGPENFETAIAAYLSPQLSNLEAFAFDRAHNFLFDYGAASGWLGLASYLGIFMVAGWRLIRKIKEEFYFSVFFVSLAVAYLVQNFFIFDSFVSFLMLFFILAMINSYFGKKNIDDQKHNILNAAKKFIWLLAVCCSLFIVYSFNFKPLLAGYRANQILSLPAKEAQQATPLLKDALALNSFGSPEIAYQVTIDYIDKVGQNLALTQNEEFYDVAANELAQIIFHSPAQPRNYIALAWLNLYFSDKNPSRIDESISLGNKIMTLSPAKKDAYLILVAAYSLSSQPAKAQQIISKASLIDKNMGEKIKNYYDKLNK